MHWDLLAEMVRLRRAEMGLSQRELAGLANVSLGTVWSLENAHNNATIESLDKIGTALGGDAYMMLDALYNAVSEWTPA